MKDYNFKKEDATIAAGQALKERNYWLTKLSDKPVRSHFPYDHVKRQNTKPVYGTVKFKITHELFSRLMALSRGSDYTLHMILMAELALLLNKYTDNTDIIFGAPIDRQEQEGDFINTVLALRNQIKEGMTFKDVLLQVRQTIIEATEHQNYPIETLLFDLGIEFSQEDFPLFDVAIVTENIQEKKYIQHIRTNINFSFFRIQNCVQGQLDYNSLLYDKATIERIVNHFISLMKNTLFNVDVPVLEVEVLSEEEKHQLLFEFNNTKTGYPQDKTLHELFQQQVERTPNYTAVGFTTDISDIYEELNSKKIHENRLERLGISCFRTNKFIFKSDLNQFEKNNPFKLLKTHRHDIVVVNENVVRLLELFDGETNLESIFSGLKNSYLKFLLYTISIDDVLEISYKFDRKEEISLKEFEDFVCLVKSLYKNNLIELVDVNPNETRFEIPILENFDPEDSLDNTVLLDDLFKYKRDLSEAEVLLLGDTPGQSTSGLLYMASYLRRHQIKAYALFNHSSWHSNLLKKQIEELLSIVKPKVVGVSMKWFLHMARVLEICKIVKAYAKEHSRHIKVVVGGNSASFYWKDIFKYDCIDYLIRGDGEIPFLKICQGEHPSGIPNCVYREEGEVIANPITYLQTADNSSNIYLSHMDGILLSDYTCIFGIFFIFTQKGCRKNCHYCGGCNIAQRRSFNRSGLFRRNIDEVRKDLIESKKYASTIYFLFDDYSNESLLDYCKKAWSGIDLSNHFGFLSNVIPPSPELIEYSNKVFKYVYWNIDMASMSDRHRQQLLELNMVKYQPTDKEVLEMFDQCEKYDNNEILINIITGLPYFNEEDIKHSEEIEAYIMENYSCFGEFFWARLHAEPGAPVAADAEKYNMYSRAQTFEEFFKISKRNFYDKPIYPNVDNYDYPFIYFKDEALNSKVSRYYSQTSIKSATYREDQKRKLNTYYKSLSYQELNKRANQIAAVLRQKGVVPGTIVGIMVERSLEMIVGLLGILKAGGLYLPIDPEYPPKRIKYMLEDCNAVILLTQQHLINSIDFKGKWINLDQKGLYQSKGGPDQGNMNQAADLAYIIFTSGSTGQPKGVMISHQAIVNTLSWRKDYYQFDAADKVLQVPPFSFDSSVEDIFTPLISGSGLILIPPHKLLEMKFVRDVFKRIYITHFLITPALYKIFLGEIYENLKGLKSVTVAGDSFTEELVIEHFRKLNNVKLYNEYGPTENSVCSTVYEFRPGKTKVLIGKPINNVNCYILNQKGQLNPVGAAGELCVSGVGLSNGYQNNPQLTAEKFVMNPFVSGERLYRTGDLVRWLPDGNIEFVGRVDFQVKIRGFRIEPGEIKTQLLEHEDIKDVVVITRGKERGEKYLCAYIVSSGSIETGELREYAAQKLPYYMVPSFFTIIDKIPVTLNGKVDHRALPEPGMGGGGQVVPPQNEIQEKLALLWSRELGIDKTSISIDTNFFDLGGDSLKATTLIAKIHKECNALVPLIELFRVPTIRGLGQIINQFKEEKFATIGPVEKKEYYALSSVQRRLYVLQQMGAGINISYNLPHVMFFEGDLDVKKFEETFKKLIARHESLRTSFEMKEGEPVQKIHENEEVKFRVEYYDGTGDKGEQTTWGRGKGTGETSEVIIKDFIRPFDLSRVPLLRVGLIKKSGKKHIMMLDMHHIATDGRSEIILTKEFMLLYAGNELSPLRLHYKDYSEWQQNQVRREALRRQEEYWLERFEGKLPILNMPTDYTRPAVQSFEGNIIGFEIREEETKELNEMARLEGATLFMILLALYNLFLSKLSNQQDIIVGTPIAARTHADLEKIIGMFVNSLALWNYPSGEKRFDQFLREVKENTLTAFENQEYPYEELVEKVSVQRDLSRNPLFDVMFVLQNIFDAPSDFSDEEERMESLKIIPYSYENRTAKFDLTLIAVEKGETFYFIFEYCTKLFREDTIRRFITHFKNIITQVLENPGKKISGIEIITGDEKKRLLYDFNDTKAGYPQDKVIHELFEEQAGKTPGNIAVEGVGTRFIASVPQEYSMQIAYRELNKKSNQLAHLLRARGVRPDSIVPIMIDRSTDMIIVMLGILKSGGAYLPIDPEYPPGRILYMLNDSMAGPLISSGKFNNPLKIPRMIDLLDDEICRVLGADNRSANPEKITHPGNLLYVIYTSGSTGKSKGVLVKHRGFVNLVYYHRKVFSQDPGARISQAAGPAFDAMAFEIWPCLLSAGTLVIADNETRRVPGKMKEWLIKNEITISFQPTVIAERLLLEEWPRQGIALRALRTAGEQLTRYPGPHHPFQLFNLYGPTEDTVWTTWTEVKADQANEKYPWIGKPVANHRIYILAVDSTLQAVGVQGELCIAGAGLAVGYLNRPDLTAEKFAADPFVPGEKMYRTGDRARWQPDGNIEFLGRIDNQVKIRGFRIEPGEIESQLMAFPHIKEAVVVDRKDEEKSNYLIAYVVSDAAIDGSELRYNLSKILPDYMIPVYFVRLDEIPLTPNGKVDRKALPAPTFAGVKEVTAPKDEVEKRLVRIWSRVLGIEEDRISTGANFFELGGHSLKATILTAQMHEEFAAEIPISKIFHLATLKELSQYIKRTAGRRHLSIESAERKEYYSISSAQKRLYIMHQMDAESRSYNLPMVVLLEGKLEKNKFAHAFKKMINRHESLRTSFEITAGRTVQKIHSPGEIEFETEYHESEEERVNAVINDFIRPFDLGKAPLMRVGLVKIDVEKHLLMVDIHHIITDGVSMEIFKQDFMVFYKGEEPPVLRIQYKDFTGWQNNRRNTGKIKDQEEYWLGEYKGDIPVMNLPTDYVRPSPRSFEGTTAFFYVSRENTAALKNLALKEEATLFITMLTIFNVLFSKLSRQEDIIIGVPIAGRKHVDIKQVIGFFVGTLALRNYPTGEKTFRGFLEEVKKRTLNAYDNQDYQFEDIVARLEIKRDPSRNPLFDVLFVLENVDIMGQSDLNIHIPGLKLRTYKHEAKISRFDLGLVGREVDDNLFFWWEYSTKLFKKETIERYINYFQEIITSVIDNPDIKLKDISIFHGLYEQKLEIPRTDFGF